MFSCPYDTAYARSITFDIISNDKPSASGCASDIIGATATEVIIEMNINNSQYDDEPDAAQIELPTELVVQHSTSAWNTN